MLPRPWPAVKSDNFNQGGARNALDLIQGKVAGLAITRTSSSNPNSGVAIQLRGVISVSGSIAPLIVIDGIPAATSISCNRMTSNHSMC